MPTYYIKICSNTRCNKEFQVLPRYKNQKYCSKHCVKKYKKYTICINDLCNIELNSTQNKFCSQSCANSYNNKNRSPRSVESRKKTSESVKKNRYKRSNGRPLICKVSFCSICNTVIKNKRSKTCSKTCFSVLQSTKMKLRLRKGRWFTKAQWYVSPYAGRVFLESSWEVTVANELDYYKIKWIRPKYFKYLLNNEIKSYYPDFYLIDFDVYLDPKNLYQQKIDKDKLAAVVAQNRIHLIILNKTQLTWKAINNKILETYY